MQQRQQVPAETKSRIRRESRRTRHRGYCVEHLKHQRKCINYVDAILPFVKSGGIIIGDNALAWGYVADREPDFEPENVKGIQSFNKALSEHPLLFPPCLIPLGDGMAMAVKK